MTFQLRSRIHETTTGTGTGALALAGAVAGKQTFASHYANTDTMHYCITMGTDWEVGLGTYATAGNTITRTTVLASSNSDTAVNWTAGTKDIFVAMLGPSDMDATAKAAFLLLFGAPSDTAIAALEIAVQSEQETGTDTTRAVTPGRQHFHPSAAKTWANFNSAGTVAGSYNLTSITDNGTGDFSVNIATDFSGVTYAATAFCGRSGGNAPLFQTTDSAAAGVFSIRTAVAAGTNTDAGSPDMYFATAFGDQ